MQSWILKLDHVPGSALTTWQDEPASPGDPPATSQQPTSQCSENGRCRFFRSCAAVFQSNMLCMNHL